MSRNQEIKMNQKQSVPVETSAPNVRNSMQQQKRNVTGLDV
jgi:hypothetical protein